MTTITDTKAPSTWDEKAHPRGHASGKSRFADKVHTPAEATLIVTSPLAERYDTLDEKLTAMREELEARVADLETDENWNAYLETMAKFHNYSFSNAMLIALQRPDATRVAGFNKWKELGRVVKAGERGISIFAPKRIRTDATDSSGKTVYGSDGKPLKEHRIVGFTTAAVFDISQTEGDELPSVQRELSEEPPEGFVEDLENAIAAAGYTVIYEDSLGSPSKFGSTDPRAKTVTIKGTLSPGSRAQVLAHELGHIQAGHCDEGNLAEYHTGHGGQRGRMEVEAESVSSILCRANGMESVNDVTATYVAGWARVQKDSPDVVAKAAENVHKAVKGLLVGGGFRNAIA